MTIQKSLIRRVHRKVKSYLRHIRESVRYVISTIVNNIPQESGIPIEVCLVTVSKDFGTLKLCLDSVRKFVRHPITKVSVISRENARIMDFCENNECIFIDELSVLGYGLEKFQDINEAKLKGREGWFFQQLLKLGFDKICEREHYLVVDTDTIFLKPRIFKFGDATIFEYSGEHHVPYKRAYKKLMGFGYSSSRSFVTHCMLFEKTVLKKLKEAIENKHKISWDSAIMKFADYSHASFFSEYETYGNFFLRYHKRNVKRSYWFNYKTSDIKKQRYPFWAKSISSHTYMRSTI